MPWNDWVNSGVVAYGTDSNVTSAIVNWPITNAGYPTVSYQYPAYWAIQYPLYDYQPQIYNHQIYNQQIYNQLYNGVYNPIVTPPYYGESVRVTDEDAAKAVKKAEALLLMVLNDKQKGQYKEFGYFETEVKDKVYRIKKGYSGNVELIKDGKAKTRFCIHTSDYLPDPDTMLAQLLMLRTDEKKFLEVANHTQLL